MTTAAYEQAFVRSPIGMALIGLDSRFIEVNAALAAIAGREREQLVGVTFDSITHPDDVDADMALAIQVVRGEREVFIREKRYVRPDGSIRWVDVSGSLIRDEHGNPKHFVFHVQDITDRRGALHALSQSEARFRSAFDDALTGIALTGPDGRLRRINAVACQILGRDAERLTGVPVAELTHPDDSEVDREHARAMLAGETEGGRWEKRYVHASGRTVWVDISSVLVRNPDGSPRHFITQMADISERKRAEQVKDEFLATISHELRTPLTSIQGYIDLLTEEDDLSGDERSNAVAVVHRNADRLRRLVDDVQFIAQARADSLSMHRTDVHLDRLVGERVESAAARAAERGLQLSVRSETLRLRGGDADRLGQAVDHLVTNALNYTEAGGHVEVRLSCDGPNAVIEVADTGVGLSDEDKEQLFERFFRSSTAVDGAVQGVGLGLSIVKAIAELHGGRVNVASTLGVGTTVSVRLPLAA